VVSDYEAKSLVSSGKCHVGGGRGGFRGFTKIDYSLSGIFGVFDLGFLGVRWS
jgi:hypothetical protein